MKQKYFNLRSTLLADKITVTELCKSTGLSYQGFYKRIESVVKWTLEDMSAIRDYINKKTGNNYTIDYLFKEEY